MYAVWGEQLKRLIAKADTRMNVRPDMCPCLLGQQGGHTWARVLPIMTDVRGRDVLFVDCSCGLPGDFHCQT